MLADFSRRRWRLLVLTGAPAALALIALALASWATVMPRVLDAGPTGKTKTIAVSNAAATRLQYASGSEHLWGVCNVETTGLNVFLVESGASSTAQGQGPYCDTCVLGASFVIGGTDFARTSAGSGSVRCRFYDSAIGAAVAPAGGGSGNDLDACQESGGANCAMSSPGVTFPNLGVPYGNNGTAARLDSAGTCTDNSGSYPCLKLTGGADGAIGFAPDHFVMFQDPLIDVHLTNNTLVGFFTANRETADGRGSIFFSMYPSSEGVWIKGTPAVGGTDGTSIAMHGDVSGGLTTDNTVHIGAYGGRATNGTPLLCASADIEEQSSTVDPYICFLPDSTMVTGYQVVGTETAYGQNGISRSSGATEVFAFSNPGAGTLDVTHDGTIMPVADNTQSIGGGLGLAYASVYTYFIANGQDATGGFAVNDLSMVPNTDSVIDIGTAAKRLKTLFVDAVGDTGQALSLVGSKLSFDPSTVTTLNATDCDVDAEVGDVFKYSKSAGATISMCICRKNASTYSFAAVGAGDCT